MAIATLSAIITKARKLAATPNSNQLTDVQVIDYINSFYLYDFPAEFRALDLKDTYVFNTVRGIDTYPFDIDHWINVQEPCYVGKRNVSLFTDKYAFYQYNFNTTGPWQQNELLTTATAAIGAGPYTGTLQNTPIIRSIMNNPIPTANRLPIDPTAIFPNGYPPTFGQANIGRIQNFLITVNVSNGNTLNVTDDGAGGLLGNATAGSINYDTGAISVTFSSAPTAGEEIRVMYNPVVLNYPLAIYYGQNQLVLRPVPDQGYIVEMTAYRLPSQALLGTQTEGSPNLSGRPEELEWWECLAVGAAKKIYEDRLDMEGVAMMDKMLQERYQVCYSRTYANLGKKRIATIYADQQNFTNTVGPFGATTLN